MKTKQDLLKDNEQLFEILSKINTVNKVLKDSETQSFNALKDEAKEWQDKLSDERYRVAIIGTEKAGKSTFANALLKQNFLPEDEGRCTFTTTTIESSDSEDFAEVKFFSKKEFQDKFDGLCDEVNFQCDYNSVTLMDVDDFCSKTSSAIATSNAIDDIKSILERRNEIENFLTGETKIFSGDEILEVRNFIVDEVKARAVKEITIKSKEFKEHKNLVIYDVPGFDSPTKIHLEQAKWYMKNADVVIMLVSIADRISFVKAQADFLNETRDKNGQRLSDKLIVVASKFDKHIVDDKSSSNSKIEKSVDILINELKKYGIYKENNLFRVSSLGYLERIGAVNSKYAYPNLQKHNYSDGIDKVIKRLEEFLNGEALQIINDNFTIYKNNAIKFLVEFKKEHNPQYNEEKKINKRIELVDEKWDEIKVRIEEVVRKKQEELHQTESFNFDEMLAKDVKELWIKYLIKNFNNYVNKAWRKTKIGETSVEQITQKNENIRGEIYTDSLERMINISTNVITRENNKQELDILNLITKSIFSNENSSKKDLLKEIIDEITDDFKYTAKAYRPLILRFIRSVFDVLIKNRISSQIHEARIKRFDNVKKDIISLLAYDNNGNLAENIFSQKLVQIILTQNSNIGSKVKSMTELLKYAKEATNEKEMRKEIETDLNNMAKIFTNILLKAIQIEIPFRNSLNAQLEEIFEDVNENAKSQLKKFIRDNIKEIAPREFSNLELDTQMLNSLRDIISKIENLEN